MTAAVPAEVFRRSRSNQKKSGSSETQKQESNIGGAHNSNHKLDSSNRDD